MTQLTRANLLERAAAIWIKMLDDVVKAATVYGYLQVEWRIQELERSMSSASNEIQDLVSKHIEDEEERMVIMEEQLKWYQKEFNMNPLSWRKKKK